MVKMKKSCMLFLTAAMVTAAACDGKFCMPEGSVVVRGSNELSALVVSDGVIYWIDNKRANENYVYAMIKRTSVGGSDTQTLYTSDADYAHPLGSISVDETHVYWLDHCVERSSTCSRLMRVPKDGGDTVMLVRDDIYTFFVDETVVYYTTSDERGLQEGNPDGKIWVMDKAGGETDVVLEGLQRLRGVTADEDSIYWSESEGSGGSCRAVVTKMPKAGGYAVTIVDELGYLFWILADEYIFYMHEYILYRVPKDGGDKVRLATTMNIVSYSYLSHMAIDETHMYFSDPGYWEGTTDDTSGTYICGAILRISRDGGTFETVAAGQYEPRGIDFHDGYVYWASAPGTIRRIAK